MRIYVKGPYKSSAKLISNSKHCDFLKREARIACNPVTMARAEEEVKKVETSQQRLVKFGNRKKEPLVGKMGRILGSDWLPEQAR